MSNPAEEWLNKVESLPEDAYLATEIQEAVDRVSEEDGEDEYWYSPTQLKIRGSNVPVTTVHSEGGYDDSPYRKVVIKVGEQHFMKTGYYSSFDGTEWDDGVREVHGTERTIIEWN